LRGMKRATISFVHLLFSNIGVLSGGYRDGSEIFF
jgi:hypothetical protein